MKKTIVGVVVVTAILGVVGVATAWAGGYYIPVRTAEHIAREESKAQCDAEAPECFRYGWGCEEAGRGALCVVSGFYEDQYGVQKCESALHLTVGIGGYIRKHWGKPHCFYAEEF